MKRRLFSLLLASAFAFAVTGCAMFSHSSSSTSTSKSSSPKAPSEEYKVLTCAGDAQDVEAQINNMAQQGWHFVSMSAGGGDLTHYPTAILVFKKK